MIMSKEKEKCSSSSRPTGKLHFQEGTKRMAERNGVYLFSVTINRKIKENMKKSSLYTVC